MKITGVGGFRYLFHYSLGNEPGSLKSSFPMGKGFEYIIVPIGQASEMAHFITCLAHSNHQHLLHHSRPASTIPSHRQSSANLNHYQPLSVHDQKRLTIVNYQPSQTIINHQMTFNHEITILSASPVVAPLGPSLQPPRWSKTRGVG